MPAQICTVHAILRREVYFTEPTERALQKSECAESFLNSEIQNEKLCIFDFLPNGVGLDKLATALLSMKLSQAR